MLRMPGKDVLPPGPGRDFVAELRVHFREAGRPTLAEIAAATGHLGKVKKVSRETVRRLLNGEAISKWATVDTVLRALCLLGGQDPDRPRWAEPEDRFDPHDPSTCREYLRRLWNDAIDGIDPEEAVPPPPGQPAPEVPAPRPADDPWASSAAQATGGWGSSNPAPARTQGYSDEPPF